MLPPWTPRAGGRLTGLGVWLFNAPTACEKDAFTVDLKMARSFCPEFEKLPEFFSEFNLKTCLQINRLFEWLHNGWYSNRRFST